MFKTETHLHTQEVSKCSRLSASEMVKLYSEKGYKTVFVSDHMNFDFSEKNSNLSVFDAVHNFLIGYHNAKEAGDKCGVNVLLSAEYAISFNGIDNHYLLYGIDEEFIYANPNGENMTIEKLRKITKDSGALLIQAHPFRGSCFPTPLYVDGMEIYNSNPRHFVKSDEERVSKVIEQFDLFAIGGSDAHLVEDVGLSGIGSNYEIKTAEDFVNLIKNREVTVLK